MRITITGKNITVSPALEGRVERKIGKLSRFFGDETEAQVRLTLDKLRNVCEVTIPIKGGILRAENVSENNMFEAIDDVTQKLESQVKRYRTRLEKRYKSAAPAPVSERITEIIEEPLDEGEGILREKTFEVYPMTPEQATEQMDLLGHTFFLFQNTQTDGICAVYKRRDRGYGLLIPRM